MDFDVDVATATIIRADEIKVGMTVAVVMPDGQSHGRVLTVTAIEVGPYTGSIKLRGTTRRGSGPWAPADRFVLIATA